jgi:hypothetical protein
MRLVTFTTDGSWRVGLDLGENIVDAQEVARASGWEQEGCGQLGTMRSVLARGMDELRELEEAAARYLDRVGSDSPAIVRGAIRLGPPA